MKLKIFLVLLAILAAALLGLSAWLLQGLPSVDNLPQRLPPASISLNDRKGRLLYEILPAQRGRNMPLPVADIPKCLILATLATEDANFYQHPGVDAAGVLRALWINLQGGQTLAGGSTITQQVARSLLLDTQERQELSLRRKLRESILAVQLTWHYSKDEILALYLNQSYYGSLSYGIEAAAQTYFGKSANQLDLAECALIAGLPQSPAAYSPFVNPEAALRRQRVVLKLMLQNGFISESQLQLAQVEPLTYAADPYPMQAPHFSILVKSTLENYLSAAQISQGGLVVRTTLDLDWQHIAESAIQRQLAKLAKANGGLGHNLTSAALIAIDPATGAVLSMVGSPDYTDAQHGGAINMTLSPRQPGSALKPVLYAAAMDPSQPHPWTPGTMLLDVSQSFVTHEGNAYVPANYDQRQNGPVLVREALASSLNIPAVLTMQYVGVANFIQYAAHFGLDSFGDPNQYDLSLALGGGDVTLSDLTAAYAVFANGGKRIQPFTIWDIKDAEGDLLYTHPDVPSQPVIDARLAWLISDILNDNAARTLGFGPNSILRLDRAAAVKTGTTSNFHDNWTVGYTPDLVVGVWAGNTDYKPMLEVSGVSGAAPIWADYLRGVLNGQPENWFARPEGLVQVEICANSGLLPTTDCPYRKLEWFIKGTEPTAADQLNHKVTIDSLTGGLASEQTPPERRLSRLALDLPAMAQVWAHESNVLLWSEVVKKSDPASFGPASTQDALQILSPAANAVYQITPSLPAESQRLQISVALNLRAALKEPALVKIFIDGSEIQQVDQPPYQVWWQITPGKHTIWAEMQIGSSVLRSAPVSVLVKTP